MRTDATSAKPIRLIRHGDGVYTFRLENDRDFNGPCVYEVTRCFWTKLGGPTDLKWRVRPTNGVSTQLGYRYFGRLADVRGHYGNVPRGSR